MLTDFENATEIAKMLNLTYHRHSFRKSVILCNKATKQNETKLPMYSAMMQIILTQDVI